MKALKLYSSIAVLLLCVPAFAQIQVDKQVQLTGIGTDATVTGIKSVVNPQDATSVEAIQKGSFVYAISGGAGSNFTLNISPPISAYQAGMAFNFISNQNSTGPSTLNINNLGAIPIKKYMNQSLLQCNIQTGQIVTVVYDGTNFQITSGLFAPLAPSAPVATAGSGGTQTQITANWDSSAGVTGYYLDVSTASNFATCLPGDSNVNVGNVLTYNVTGLTTCGITYYYRVRAYTACATSSNSNTISYIVTGLNCITQVECGNTYVYYEVTTGTGRVWLDRNLGATEVATSSTDYLAYGSLFQWGRLADGHECINWASSTTGTPVNGSTSVLSSTDVPPNSLFIYSPNPPDDWLNPQNSNLWQGPSGTNNPCPSGFRIPTQTEWNAEQATWNYGSGDGAYDSPLKLTLAGQDDWDNGTLFQTGTYGEYWSSTVSGGQSVYIFNTPTATTNYGGPRAAGFAIRCIMN